MTKQCTPPCPPDLCREWSAQGMCQADKHANKARSHAEGLSRPRQLRYREPRGKRLDLSKLKVKL